jgi:RHH-type transcriptional regulator, proline utilization regulon repressor / proline dehydrogenase / delta 1-pyrroline-5-carboxylate dehydrogenase
MTDAAAFPKFAAPYAEDDLAIARRFLATPRGAADAAHRIDMLATALITAIRADAAGGGRLEALLHEYALSTREGLALMVLAESLLRVPDAATADRLIEEKLAQGDFGHHAAHSHGLLVQASAWALALTARIVAPGETPEDILCQLAKRLGMPAVRLATRQAIRLLGDHFVFSETISEAVARIGRDAGPLQRYSFDMLGEGARTAADARRYRDAYADAIAAIGGAAGQRPFPDRPGISVKLSALHPRYEAMSRERVMCDLVPVVIELARAARAHDLNFTFDAEEADRLELSLDIFARTAADPGLAGWDGFGLAVQAYQKRAPAVIDYVAAVAAHLDRRFAVRLVKGAYWDSEVKRAQERGLADYPVFTRKAMTDLSYMACAEKLLRARAHLFPQFATHNALTVAAILEQAGGAQGFEFQRLHGMGEVLYARLDELHPDVACRTYAPVGDHADLLAYLVRRLLENGANSSFVAAVADPGVPVARLLRRPDASVGNPEAARHPALKRPPDLFLPERRNSAGIEFGDRTALDAVLREIEAAGAPVEAAPIVDGEARQGRARRVVTPIDDASEIGSVIEADDTVTDAAMAAAAAGFAEWSATSAETRAAALDGASDLLEQRRGRFLHLLQMEGGKTLDDAVAELREAVDFCRYYAAEGRRLFGGAVTLPGPVGESNALRLKGRGAFVAISPWNFPLSIFLGQVAAALMAGNSVVAKPAEQTPLIAAEVVRLFHEAGVPQSALHLATGDGKVGARLVAHPAVAGVVFTGSTDVARNIHRSLAAKEGAIVPLIAETGGLNAMIVDATALPEQVTDDVMISAFRSAGQRCSALRLLFIQEDVADRIIRMIVGAAAELRLGDPRDIGTQMGPVIDGEAKRHLEGQIATLKAQCRLIFAGTAPDRGFFVAPHIFEIDDPALIKEEIFGPVLPIVRYRADRLDRVCDAIAATGYGLTLGIHSRIDGMAERIADRLRVGNVYVNRSIIGAVVGVQPFGGVGLSGTGPKAGGPYYLARFATEQTITANTAAIGGNATLLDLREE